VACARKDGAIGPLDVAVLSSDDIGPLNVAMLSSEHLTAARVLFEA
jgi:hypothetical protein